MLEIRNMVIDKGTTEKAGSREWLALAVLALPTLLLSMDFTITYLAIPVISKDLRPSSAQLLWITDIYAFLQAGLVITMGTLGDSIGQRRVLMGGAFAFAIASGCAAFSTTPGLLIASRALLGIAGATLAPSILSIIRNMFHDDRQRTIAIGTYTTCFSIGTMLGPLVGGFLLYHFWWGSAYLAAIPVMILLLIAGPVLLPEFKSADAPRFDFLSALLLIAATLAVIYGIKRFAENDRGWLPLLAIAGGLSTGYVFFRRQQTHPDPLIDLTVFRVPAFNAALIMLSIALFGWAGLLLFVAQYLQLVMNLNPLVAGLWTLPSAAAGMLGCLLAPLALAHAAKRTVLGSGLGLMALGTLLVTGINSAQGFSWLIAGAVVMSIGCGLIVTSGMDMILATAAPERAGAAAGISETGTGFGSALGIAILGSIGTFLYRGKMNPAVLDHLTGPGARAARGTLGGALAAARPLPEPVGTALAEFARTAFKESFRWTCFFTLGIILIVGVIVAVIFKRL